MRKRSSSHSIDVIDSDVYEKLRTEAKKENMSIRTYVNEKLNAISKSGDVFSNLFPELKVISIENGVAEIVDRETKQLATVRLHNNNHLSCDVCEKDRICQHVALTLGNSKFWQSINTSNFKDDNI